MPRPTFVDARLLQGMCRIKKPCEPLADKPTWQGVIGREHRVDVCSRRSLPRRHAISQRVLALWIVGDVHVAKAREPSMGKQKMLVSSLDSMR